ncbi:hypothetical protein [Brevibacillus antibioticus]|nr:hypothetical protein [Brevibacillus antibioticus]
MYHKYDVTKRGVVVGLEVLTGSGREEATRLLNVTNGRIRGPI